MSFAKSTRAIARVVKTPSTLKKDRKEKHASFPNKVQLKTKNFKNPNLIERIPNGVAARRRKLKEKQNNNSKTATATATATATNPSTPPIAPSKLSSTSSLGTAPFTPSSPSSSTSVIVRSGGLSPAVKLQGPWALQRERSDHLVAEIESKNVIIMEAKKIQSRLIGEIKLRDEALERSRRRTRQDQGTIDLLTSQVENVRNDLLAERARNIGMTRMHEGKL
jgi:hypothetical protein